MPNYVITMSFSGSSSLNIVADNEDDAIKKAQAQFSVSDIKPGDLTECSPFEVFKVCRFSADGTPDCG